MKIETTIKYYEGYIPPRCRKARYREVKEKVWSDVRECRINDVKLAFKVKGEPIYAYMGKIYKTEELWTDLAKRFTSALDMLIKGGNIYSTYYANCKNDKYGDYSGYETRDEIMDRLTKDLSKCLIIDGELYKTTPSPTYRLVTFGGCGDGTSLSVVYNQYPSDAIVGMRGLYYSALDYQAAIDKANEVAKRRGDLRDVGTFKKLIEVYMPEFVEPVLN